MIRTPIFIQGAGSISPQKTWDKKILEEGFVAHQGNRWPCIEPPYSDWIDARAIRRMSRVLQRCNVAAQLAMNEAAIDCPEAIVVGTAMGCLEDTWSFLSKMVQNGEEMLSPTSFIHSTHNTMASHLALHFKSFGHNCTFVHRTISFENSLTDAILLLEEGAVSQVLVGGADEVTDISFDLLNQLGQIKQLESGENSPGFTDGQPGWIAGEGASFFVLGNRQTASSYARLGDVQTGAGYDPEEIASRIEEQMASLDPGKTLLLAGHNGDVGEDSITDQILSQSAPAFPVFRYKSLCGEYGTASGFALWLASHVLKQQIRPSTSGFEPLPPNELDHVVIFQQSGPHHAFIRLDRC